MTESSTGTPPAKKGSGCGLVFAGILALSIAFGLWTWLAGDPEMITMQGEIVLSPSAADRAVCDDLWEMEILPDGSDARIVSIALATNTPGEGCTFWFTTRVPEQDKYAFRIEGLEDKVVQRSMIDTIGADGETELRVRLSW